MMRSETTMDCVIRRGDCPIGEHACPRERAIYGSGIITSSGAKYLPGGDLQDVLDEASI